MFLKDHIQCIECDKKQNSEKSECDNYREFHRLGQAKFAYGGLI